jgi:hypothetical protein
MLDTNVELVDGLEQIHFAEIEIDFGQPGYERPEDDENTYSEVEPVAQFPLSKDDEPI